MTNLRKCFMAIWWKKFHEEAKFYNWYIFIYMLTSLVTERQYNLHATHENVFIDVIGNEVTHSAGIE